MKPLLAALIPTCVNLTKPQKLLFAGKVSEADAHLPAPGAATDPRVEILRARIQAADNNLAGAIETLRAAQERYPAHAPVSLFLGTFLWDGGKLQDAEKAFATVLTVQPENDLALSYQALCRFAAGDFGSATSTWKVRGFSDNTLFRVRAAEHIEKTWLRNGSFMGELPPESAPAAGDKLNTKKALAQFYRRDFQGIIPHIPPPPVDDDLAEFLGSVAHEMLRYYTAAEAYLDRMQSRRNEWPDPLIALQARLLTRRGRLKKAAAEFSKVLVVGPEDYGVNYYLGIICLAYNLNPEARQYFLRAFTSYMVDTREFQWWQLEQVLLQQNSSHRQAPLV